MSEPKRIDPSALPATFERIGLLPQQRGFFGGFHADPRACLLTAEMIDAGDKVPGGHAKLSSLLKAAPWDGPALIGMLAADLGYSAEYAAGLVEGWDGNAGKIMGSHPEFLLGIEDGGAAWEACQPLLERGAS